MSRRVHKGAKHFTVTDRGFKHGDPVPSVYGGFVKVYESSSASEPRIWVMVQCPENLNEPSGRSKDAVAHLNLEDAIVLRDQLDYLIKHHYQL